MKILFIFPPLWDINLSPMLGLPALAGRLKEEGHQVEILDLNAKFMNFVFNKDFIKYFNEQINFYQEEFKKFYAEKSREKFQHIENYFNNWTDMFYQFQYNLPPFYKQNCTVLEIAKILSQQNNDELIKFYDFLKDFSNCIFEKIFNLVFLKNTDYFIIGKIK